MHKTVSSVMTAVALVSPAPRSEPARMNWEDWNGDEHQNAGTGLDDLRIVVIEPHDGAAKQNEHEHDEYGNAHAQAAGTGGVVFRHIRPLFTPALPHERRG